jgi:hypothetical protein
MVVGWYHSHPNLGAFFSGTDRKTQRSFFSQRYSLGLVADPVRSEEAWFVGPDATALSPDVVFAFDSIQSYEFLTKPVFPVLMYQALEFMAVGTDGHRIGPLRGLYV